MLSSDDPEIADRTKKRIFKLWLNQPSNYEFNFNNKYEDTYQPPSLIDPDVNEKIMKEINDV